VTLELVPFAEGTDPAEFAAALAPGFGGDEGPAREILAETCALLTRDPRPAPWGSYVVHLDGRPIGIAAFKSAPAPDGEVEIAYMTFPAYEGRGHATATIAALVRIAEAAGAAPIAHTLPEENASNKALRRNGFAYAGELDDPEDGLVWRWEKPRG
jgi:[ribosomal protein S5]-alanine N-acetyltransferase